MTRILICGGRDFADKRFLMDIMEPLGVTCVIEGGARGADAIGKAWARWRGLPVLTCEANWDKYGKRAGPLRNQWMLDHAKPEMVVAFPGGVGTADMVRRARAAGLVVIEAAIVDGSPKGENGEAG